MNRRESSGEDEIIDPLYNGRICHAQCWSSYPDFAAKIVSWIAVRLRLRHSWSRVLSALPGTHSLIFQACLLCEAVPSSPLWKELLAFFFVSWRLILLMCLCSCESYEYLRVEIMGTQQWACVQHLVNIQCIFADWRGLPESYHHMKTAPGITNCASFRKGGSITQGLKTQTLESVCEFQLWLQELGKVASFLWASELSALVER